MTDELAERLWQARTARNIGIKNTAIESGVAASVLSKFERGMEITQTMRERIEKWVSAQPAPEPEDPAERWRAIPGWEGFYEVSDKGRVRSVERIVPHGKVGTVRIRSRVLKQGAHRAGHLWVELCGPQGSGTRQVHQLVLEAFVGPKPEGMLTCHGDGNPQNNHLSNLRWGTQTDNMRDAIQHGTHRSFGLVTSDLRKENADGRA